MNRTIIELKNVSEELNLFFLVGTYDFDNTSKLCIFSTHTDYKMELSKFMKYIEVQIPPLPGNIEAYVGRSNILNSMVRNLISEYLKENSYLVTEFILGDLEIAVKPITEEVLNKDYYFLNRIVVDFTNITK